MNELKNYLDNLSSYEDVVIEDCRELGMGVFISKQPFYYVSISYTTDKKFYISTKGCWIDSDTAMVYMDELKTVSKIVSKLNELI